MKTFNLAAGPFKFEAYCPETKSECLEVIQHLENAPFKLGGLDIETLKIQKYKEHKKAGLDPHLSEIRLIQVYSGKNVAVLDLKLFDHKVLKKLLYSKEWVAHYAKFELAHLTKLGFPNLSIDCTQIQSQIIDNAEFSPFEPPEDDDLDEVVNQGGQKNGTKKYGFKKHSLQACVDREFKVFLDKGEQTSDWGAKKLTDSQLRYAGLDAVCTLALHNKYSGKIETFKMEKHYDVLKKLQQVVANMQLRGFPVDWKLHSKFIEKWDDKHGDLTRACYKHFGNINLNSGKQLSQWVVSRLRTEPEVLKRWPTTKSHTTEKPSYSFDSTTLSRFKGVKGIEELLEMKKFGKLLSTYGESFAEEKNPVTGRIHSTFTIGETRTGRLSSRSPNIQQWPRGESRAVFAAPEGYSFVICDFAQVELQIQAELSRDPVMLRAFKEGRDIYCEFGSEIYGKQITKKDSPKERAFAKEASLAFAYGMGATKFVERASKSLGYQIAPKLAEATKNKYYKRYRHYIDWCNKIRARAEQLGYSRTLLGKVRHLNKDEVYCKAPNTVIQGTGLEMMAISMIHMEQNGCELVNSAHDEALDLVPEGKEKERKEQVEESMRGAYRYLFPDTQAKKIAEASVGKSWLDKD